MTKTLQQLMEIAVSEIRGPSAEPYAQTHDLSPHEADTVWLLMERAEIAVTWTNEALTEIAGLMPAVPIACSVCSEPIELQAGQWIHTHGDISCGTGDGATAYPPGIEYAAGRYWPWSK